MKNKQENFDFNVHMLKKIRESCHLTLREVAERTTNIKPTEEYNTQEKRLKARKKYNAQQEKLKAWENGEKKPTWAQAYELITKTYKCPFGLIFLDDSPKEGERIVDFRSGDIKKDFIYKQFERDILFKHSELSAIADEENWPCLEFVGSMKNEQSVHKIVDAMRQLLNVSFQEQLKKNKDDILKYIREQCEGKGIFTFFLNNIGRSTHKKTKLDLALFSGFAISDDARVPLIVINNYTKKNRQIFTYIHELCHLLLGATAKTNDLPDKVPESEVEKLCDAVALEFLLPEKEFKKKWNDCEENNLFEKTKQLGYYFKVSQITIARKARDLEFCTWDDYQEIYQEWDQSYKKSKENKQGGGPSPDITHRARFGKFFFNTVLKSYEEGTITASLAQNIAQMSVSKMYNLLEEEVKD